MNYKNISMFLFLTFILLSEISEAGEINFGVLKITCTQETAGENWRKETLLDLETYIYSSENGPFFTNSAAILTFSFDEDGEKSGSVKSFSNVEFSLLDNNIKVTARNVSPNFQNIETLTAMISLRDDNNTNNGNISIKSSYQFARGQFEDSGATDLVGEPVVENRALGNFRCSVIEN